MTLTIAIEYEQISKDMPRGISSVFTEPEIARLFCSTYSGCLIVVVDVVLTEPDLPRLTVHCIRHVWLWWLSHREMSSQRLNLVIVEAAHCHSGQLHPPTQTTNKHVSK